MRLFILTIYKKLYTYILFLTNDIIAGSDSISDFWRKHMIKRSSIMEREIKESMRGGNGSVELIHVFKKEELKGNARLCARIILQPGCSIGLHEHVNEEEIYYIISGKGIVNDNGNTQEVLPGDSVITGGGAFHSIENDINCLEPLELMAVILLY